jgi:flavodoxin
MVGGEREKGVVMRAVVAYESMYGNTRRVAEAIAAGLQSTCSLSLVPVSQLERDRWIRLTSS